MRTRSLVLSAAIGAALLAPALFSTTEAKPSGNKLDGQFIFRFDTFGDEQLWTDILRMHEVVQSAVSPRTALAVGLKVDSSVLPPNFLSKYSLDDPATTVELLRRNAVVGLSPPRVLARERIRTSGPGAGRPAALARHAPRAARAGCHEQPVNHTGLSRSPHTARP